MRGEGPSREGRGQDRSGGEGTGRRGRDRTEVEGRKQRRERAVRYPDACADGVVCELGRGHEAEADGVVVGARVEEVERRGAVCGVLELRHLVDPHCAAEEAPAWAAEEARSAWSALHSLAPLLWVRGGGGDESIRREEEGW